MNFSVILPTDKQQEFDLPSLRIDENEATSNLPGYPRSRSPRLGGPPMSQISGVKRPLSHTNSFTGERLPTFGVETPNENDLGTLLGELDTWGIDIFKIGDLSCNRPLTCVAYTIFQVTLNNFHFDLYLILHGTYLMHFIYLLIFNRIIFILKYI